MLLMKFAEIRGSAVEKSGASPIVVSSSKAGLGF
jgi:hypothetical protein